MRRNSLLCIAWIETSIFIANSNQQQTCYAEYFLFVLFALNTIVSARPLYIDPAYWNNQKHSILKYVSNFILSSHFSWLSVCLRRKLTIRIFSRVLGYEFEILKMGTIMCVIDSICPNFNYCCEWITLLFIYVEYMFCLKL